MSDAQTSASDQDGFVLAIDAHPAAVGRARGTFASWLAEVGVGEDALSELPIVFSELVTNAAEASSYDQKVSMQARLDDHDVVLLEVSNSFEPTEAEITRWNFDDALRGGGRGLVIVRELTDDLHVDATDGTLTVRCRRKCRVRRR